MKLVLLLITIISFGKTIVHIETASQLNNNAIIRQLFEMLRYFIKNGYTEKNIPVIDPYKYDHKTLDVSLFQEVISIHADFTNGVINGCSNYQLEHVEFIKEQIAVDIYIIFPILSFKSEFYTMEGDIYNAIPLLGEGNFEFEVHNFSLQSKFYLKQSLDEKAILIHNITNPQYNIEKVLSRTEFDGNIDDIANAIINDLLANYLNRFNHYIAQTYVGYMVALMNPYLNNFDSWKILAALLENNS